MTTAAVSKQSLGGRGAWWSSRLAWILLALVAAAALAVGSVHPPRSDGAARAASLDTVIKCPSCDDLSIAESDAPSAVTLRHSVAAFVREGWSNGRIESWVTQRYGSGALLVPPSGGADDVLFLAPAAAVLLAAASLGWYFWRHRVHRFSEPPGAP